MKRSLIILVGIATIGIWLWLAGGKKQGTSPSTPHTVSAADPSLSQKSIATAEPVAPFFDHYGDPDTEPQQDLQSVAQALEHFWLLIKDPDALPVMSNATIMRSLAGNNPHRLQFISSEHPALDDQHRLLDRWGTPLHFHPHSLTSIDIHSAGPDRILFTPDDLQAQVGKR